MREEHERTRERSFSHDPSSLPTLERCAGSWRSLGAAGANLLLAAAMRAHRHPVAAPQRDDRLELDAVRRVVLEPPPPTDRREHDARFELGEPLADTHPRAAAEGQERMPVFDRLPAHPSLRPESRRLGPPTRIVMEEPG